MGTTKFSPDMTASRLREFAAPADGSSLARAGARARNLDVFLVPVFSREGIIGGTFDPTVPAEEGALIRHPGVYEAVVAPAKGQP